MDMTGRLLADRLSAHLGQPVVVENRAGATGLIGSRAVAAAPPDGYTLLLMSATVHSVAPHLMKAYPFDPIEGFTPISQTVGFPFVLVVAADSPYRTVEDLIAAAKHEPGSISYGSFGVGSAPYVVSESFARAAGVKMLHVPYQGASPAITDLLGGRIHFLIDSIPSPLALVRGGKLRALAVTTARRSSVLPSVPTLAESVPGLELTTWIGVGAPPGLPKDVATKLHSALQKTAAEPEYAAKLRERGLDAVASESPEQFRTWLVTQKDYWGTLIRAANIQPQ